MRGLPFLVALLPELDYARAANNEFPALVDLPKAVIAHAQGYGGISLREPGKEAWHYLMNGKPRNATEEEIVMRLVNARPLELATIATIIGDQARIQDPWVLKSPCVPAVFLLDEPSYEHLERRLDQREWEAVPLAIN